MRGLVEDVRTQRFTDDFSAMVFKLKKLFEMVKEKESLKALLKPAAWFGFHANSLAGVRKDEKIAGHGKFPCQRIQKAPSLWALFEFDL